MRRSGADTGAGRRRLITAAAVVAVITAFVVTLYQPWLAQWGSTGAERDRPMAGDALIADADLTWTRSITIDAPPEQVWPWVVQMGQDKAGFYNYDWGEQLFGDPIHNATTIHPEWQELTRGDMVHPKPGGDWEVVLLEPNRLLVLDNPLVTPTDWTWATELRPLGADRTRLVTRIRSHKGTVFSYTLDVPDLILFPRLLTGIKQRAEGTLPGMAGTDTGRPFPLARLPVHWWAALAWLAGLAAVGVLGRRALGFGSWRQRRRHPHLTFWLGFVAGAGYLLMSDTPPVHFFTHRWGAGILLGVGAGIVLGRMGLRGAPARTDRRHVVSRLVGAAVEAGLFVVLPVTAVWQAATARGWTTSGTAHVVVGAGAVVAAVGVATAAWSAGRTGRRGAAVTAAVLATAYAATGSGLAVLLAAALGELAPITHADPGSAPRRRDGDHHRELAAVGS